MNPMAWIESTWWLGVPAAALIGVVLGASPLAWPLLGTALGVGAGATTAERRSPIGPVVAFGAGVTAVYAALGALAGSIDDVVTEVLAPIAGIGYVVLALLLVVLAIVTIRRDASTCNVGATRRRLAGAFAAGIPAGIVNCPACAGIITGVAAASAVADNVLYSVAVMAALGAGHTAALAFTAWLTLDAWQPPRQWVRGLQWVGGGLLLVAAAFFVRQALLTGLAVEPQLP